MPRFAANLSMLYPELPFLDRMQAAAGDGFKGVEWLFPYDHEPAELAARLQDAGLQLVLMNAPPAGTDASQIGVLWAAGMHGTACLPGREDEFRWGVALGLRYAQALGCPRVHCMAGVLPEDADRAAAHDCYVRNLQWAAAQAAPLGIDVLIEPINTRDMPGYFLNYQQQAHDVVQEVGAANLKVQMDIYHCQIMEGDVTRKIRHYLPTGRVGHLQTAAVPDRHEPGSGELDDARVFRVLDEVAASCGWQGWVGCEYRPAGNTSQGLAWRQRLQFA